MALYTACVVVVSGLLETIIYAAENLNVAKTPTSTPHSFNVIKGR